MDPKFWGFLPRCAYFSGFKRFSKNRQKVNEMAKTEATVTSGVNNWYTIFLFRNFWMWEMPVGDKHVIICLKFRFFAFKVFWAHQKKLVGGGQAGPFLPPLGRLGGTTGGSATPTTPRREMEAEAREARSGDERANAKLKAPSHTSTVRRIS